ncbi:MAG TPA: hypothetical protein VMU26_09840 [Candidatus Polarisedimenticolia bacterium]|nr:hypothetical protein [Candidatus Polarisedimenticolia bacterium]
MKIGTKYPILMALAVCVATYASYPTGAHAQSVSSRQMTQQETADRLRTHVPANEMRKFQSDLGTLVQSLYELNAAHPDTQKQMVSIMQRLTTLTPDQWTAMANAYDRPSLSDGVERIKSAMPNRTTRPGGQVVSRERTLAVTPLNTPAPNSSNSVIDPDTNTSLVEPGYGPCTPNYIDANNDFNGIFPIPSNATTDYGLFIGLNVANAAQIPLNFLCQELVVILGEGTNLPECIIAAIDQAIAFALQLSLQITDWCNGSVLAAENDSAWWNTIAIFNNLNTGVASIETQITNTQTDLDNHITSVDSDLNAHITAIDTDIDNHVAAINVNVNTSFTGAISNLSTQLTATNTDIDSRVTAVNTSVTNTNSSLSNQLTAMDTDIDTRIAGVNSNTSGNITTVESLVATDIGAADMDIDARITNADTDLNTHLTLVDNDLNTHLSAVDADVLAQGSLIGTEIATMQSLDLRVAIEKSLEQGLAIGLFETPKAEGGYLELVGTIVQTVITNLVAAGQNVGSGAAQKYENEGNTDYAAKSFKSAYYAYMSAYQTAVK